MIKFAYMLSKRKSKVSEAFIYNVQQLSIPFTRAKSIFHVSNPLIGSASLKYMILDNV